MRELNFVEPGRLEWREAADPKLQGDGEALVRPLAVATCDLDTGVIAGQYPVPGPFAFGHECVAEVVEVGDGVESVRPGSIVSVAFQISCGDCSACHAGHSGSCTETPRLAMYGLPLGGEWGGFLSDSVRVPYADAMLVELPGGVDPVAAASVSDNIVDAWRTVGPQLEATPGAPVLVCGGAGSIDLYAVALARALGAECVDYAGGRDDRARSLAAELGAEVLGDEFPDRLGAYPIVVEASANEDGLACALRSTAPDGTCTSIGIYATPTTPVPLLEMYTKNITFITGRVHAREAIPAALDLIASGRFDPAPITSREIAWDDAAEALAEYREKLVIAHDGVRA
ncbi:MAG TPA: alcohol dehydrogenase catalytic domain-containing protein [Thermoleophilaceae bacterium]|nr:alcohol dehydrogenase catalytic domain-containing protein [Thermoleophilaceae bacterium]